MRLFLCIIVVSMFHAVSGTLVLENDEIRVTFDDQNGSIIQVHNKGISTNWIGDTSLAGPVWRVAFLDTSSADRYRVFDCDWAYINDSSVDSFSYEWQADSSRLAFYWEDYTRDFTLEAFAEIDSAVGRVDFWANIDLNDSSKVCVRLVYPIVSGIMHLGQSTVDDRMTFMGEYALQRPFYRWSSNPVDLDERDNLAHHIFCYEIYSPCTIPSSPLTSEIPYYFPAPNQPTNSFNGYYWWDRTDSERYIYHYIPETGGFYIANSDAYWDNDRWHPKFVRVRRLTTSMLPVSWRDALSIEVHHTEPDSTNYCQLEVTSDGYWEEGAFIYRSWAENQSWWPSSLAARLSSDPVGASMWLLDSVGVAVFAHCASRDISSHMEVIADSLKGRILWIPSVDWPVVRRRWEENPRIPGDSLWALHAQGGYEDSLGTYWFPAGIDTLVIGTITSSGGHYTPFIFPSIIDEALQCYNDTANSEGWLMNRALNESGSQIQDEIAWMCWGTEGPSGADSLGWHDLNTWRCAGLGDFTDTTSTFSGSSDGVYYDINHEVRCYCRIGRHDHVEGFSDHSNQIREAKDSLITVIGEYAPIGSENIYEKWFGLYDFYQARAWAWPQVISEYEGRFGVSDDPDRGRLLPIWECIAHEYGPVRLDGWGALSGDSTSYGEYGDILYLLLGRTLLWGGLPELNYEWAAFEGFGWAADSCDTTYIGSYFWTPDTIARGEEGWYDGCSTQLSFLANLTEARCSFANQFLVFGRMQREPRLVIPGSQEDSVSLNWCRYNTTEALDSGTVEVPRIVATSWTNSDTLGITLLNLSVAALDSIHVYLAPSYWDLAGSYSFTKELASGSVVRITLDNKGWATVSLPSREVVLIRGERQ